VSMAIRDERGGLLPLRRFVRGFTQLVEDAGDDEARLLAEGGRLLSTLISRDDWLPERYAQPSPVRYMQYLLHCDPLERFSVVSFVWGPGQATPIHDHTVWGLIGMLRGAEACTPYQWLDGRLVAGASRLLRPGCVDAVSPRIGDLHAVANALADQPSVSIHVYGANIGAVERHTYAADTGQARDFVSGYALDVVPNLYAN
jgi:3-mercaptopropionate dioxygenase